MSDKSKILIIRFSSIGDIVLTTAVIRCLKKQLDGEVELHFVTKNNYFTLLSENPYLDKIYSIEKSVGEVIEELKAEEYNYVIDLHKNSLSREIVRKLNVLSFNFNKLNIRKWFKVNFKWDVMPDVHIVTRYLKSTEAFGVKYDGNGLDFFLPTNISSKVKLPDRFKHGYVVMVIGANHFTKQIPEIKLSSIIKNTSENFILVGGKSESSVGERLETCAKERVWNTAGKMSLHQSAYIIQQAKVVITPDTGMMHIAAAFQKKIISIWGNTIPEFGMYPLLKSGNESRSIIIENKLLSCRPCSKIGYKKCPKKHFNCMMKIDVNDIVSALNELS